MPAIDPVLTEIGRGNTLAKGIVGRVNLHVLEPVRRDPFRKGVLQADNQSVVRNDQPDALGGLAVDFPLDIVFHEDKGLGRLGKLVLARLRLQRKRECKSQ